ncbi:pirin family protein [Hyphobacterium marinum]|uniref:Pirin family protein n=1 Tax=Hyphobacterium marinum TaxID=3116574 RepID=A0ABU7M068_9PROT|nr:pirin family protein [Hyphobacterium sp. Y6023]MEE2567091.1 pirin family protein [Hyphobacterium sp. Y6023]
MIDLLIRAKEKDLGGFAVRRVLPHPKRRLVGPFIFFDHIGPAKFPPGKGVDVRPHPHIGLATVTYLFEGEMDHRDSLGVHQTIYPGDVNWMTAGKGIVHSERTGDDARKNGFTMHGIQTWVALPEAHEETDPEFHHYGKADLPVVKTGGATLRVILGTGYGMEAPAKVFSPTFYVHADMPEGSTVPVSNEHEERAVYIARGQVTLDGETLEEGDMAVLSPGSEPEMKAMADSVVMLCGGAPLPGKRHIFWNFVSSDRDRLERAKADWTGSAEGGFEGTRFRLPDGETEHIPLPE